MNYCNIQRSPVVKFHAKFENNASLELTRNQKATQGVARSKMLNEPILKISARFGSAKFHTDFENDVNFKLNL